MDDLNVIFQSLPVNADTKAGWRPLDAERVERVLFSAVVGFTIVSVAGFALFATPHGLSITAGWLAGSSFFREVYGVAFAGFAQGHVALTAALLLWHLSRRIGWPAFSSFLMIASATFLIEWIGTTTGWPFGHYAYGTALGPLIAGAVPVWIPVSWFTVAVPAYALALKTFSGNKWRIRRILSGAFLVMLWDITLDPAMSGLTGYWVWSETGPLFDTPLENLAGWFFTGVVIMLLLELLGGAWWGQQLSYPLMRSYYGLLLALPAGMLLSAGEWAPVALTGGLVALALAVRTMFRPKPAATPIGEKPSNTVDRQSAGDFFWANSRSFSFASLAFPSRQRRLVGLVYAFCRITDDIVDEGHGDAEEVHRKLQDWLHEARNAYYGRSAANDWLHELMQTSRAHGVPFSIMEELVRGVERDLNAPSFAAVEELKDYCYGVASTVGLWLCHLNDVRDEWMLDRAAALGRAMQITNIIRDVGEDLGRGRLYLPADILQRHGLTAETLRLALERGEVPSSYSAVMEEMIELADQEYWLAWQAIPHLPRGFSTPTAVAAEVYRGIQTVVARNGYDNLTRRARTSIVAKVALATRAWCRLLWRRLRHRFGAASILAGVAALILLLSAIPSDAPAHQSDATTLVSLRSLYIEAGDERDAIVDARTLIESLDDSERAEPVIEAYRAAFEVARAKHAFWPFSKLKHVKRGLPVLDRLAKEHPDHVEVRFLRLVSCYYLPGIMGRKDTARKDLAALCALLPPATAAFPEPWYRRMVSFVLGSSEIDDSCRLELQGILTARDLPTDSIDGESR